MDLYNHYFIELADVRANDLPFFKTPIPPIILLAGYFLFIFYFGPRFMQSRKPYNLKNLIAVYNLIQVTLCAFLMKSLLNSGFNLSFLWKCVPVDYSRSVQAMNMQHAMYYTFLIKAFELIETVFFILRKKPNQITFLHVYHHASTFTLTWFFVKFIPGGMLVFSIFINSFVHIIMYFYYFMSIFDKISKLKILQLFKKSITLIQMIQFCFILINTAFALPSTCSASKLFLLFYIPNVMLLLYMFYDFYKKAYKIKQEQERSKQCIHGKMEEPQRSIIKTD